MTMWEGDKIGNNPHFKKSEGEFPDTSAKAGPAFYNNNDSASSSGYTAFPPGSRSPHPHEPLQKRFWAARMTASPTLNSSNNILSIGSPTCSNSGSLNQSTENTNTQESQPTNLEASNTNFCSFGRHIKPKSEIDSNSDPNDLVSTNPNVYTLTDKTICKIDHKEIPRPADNLFGFYDEKGNIRSICTSEITGPIKNLNSYYIIDNGNASPMFMRTTLYQVPRYSDSLDNCRFQFAIIAQPFAKPLVGQEVPLIDLNESLGIDDPKKHYLIRCKNCGAYINSFVLNKMDSLGKICNFCDTSYKLTSHENQVLDNLCTETYDNPRILRGSVDYLAPLSYYSRKPTVLDHSITRSFGKLRLSTSAREQSIPDTTERSPKSAGSARSAMTEPPLYNEPTRHDCEKPPSHVIIIDCNKTSSSLNLKTCVLQGIKYCLSQRKTSEFEFSEFCVITYTSDIQFYTFNGKFKRVLIVSDEEPFIPCALSDIFVNIKDNSADSVLEYLDNVCKFKPTGNYDLECSSSCVQLGVHILAERGNGGTVSVFYADLPDSTAITDDISLGNGLKIFYDGIILQCYESNIAVDSFFCIPRESLVDFHNRTYLSIQTGGRFKIYPKFDYRRDYLSLYHEISKSLCLSYAYGCELRLRCSKGLFVKELICPQTTCKAIIDKSTLKVPRISPETSVAFLIGMDDIAEAKNTVYVQCACLHLNSSGRTCVRVHTLELYVTSSTNTVYKYSDADSIANIYMRTLAYNLLRFKKSIKIDILNEIVEILSAYRHLCAAYTPANQLILPDSLKLIPPYCMAAFKIIALYHETESTHMASLLYRSMNWSVSQTVYIFPRLYSLGRENNFLQNTIKFEQIPTSGEYVYSDGMYLLDIGDEIFLYFGMHVPLKVLKAVFGKCIADMDWTGGVLGKRFNGNILWADLQLAKSELADEIQNCVDCLRQCGAAEVFKLLLVIAPNTRGEEIFKMYLIEDAYKRESSYINFLCDIHSKIHYRINHLG